MKLPRLKRMMFIAWLPAVGLAVFLCVWGLIERKADLVAPLLPALRFLGEEALADPRQVRIEIWTIAYTYFMNVELWISMVLILLVGPNLISQDLRFNALPLYFSRPLRRIDYFLGKLGVIGSLLGMAIVAPAVIAYILGMLFSLDITILRDTFPVLLGTIAYGLLIVVSAGTLILALSSLSRNSRYISLLWAAIWFVTGVMSTILVGVEQREQRNRAAAMSFGYQFQGTNREELQRTLDHLDEQMVEQQKSDWRPMVSYTENLRRVGRQLLGTEATWETIRQLQPPERRTLFRMQFMNPEYPWYWSAGVLAVLFGLSACILNFRVRSLDRLK